MEKNPTMWRNTEKKSNPRAMDDTDDFRPLIK